MSARAARGVSNHTDECLRERHGAEATVEEEESGLRADVQEASHVQVVRQRG